jgi:hypothetical protein
MRVHDTNKHAVRPIWTVIGRMIGSAHPDQWVIAGNHRDAWVFGGGEPASGSTVLLVSARVLGSLARSGFRPSRTIILASWDAEEFALASSTEWGEEHEHELREKAVAYLNVDAAVSGSTFAALAVPALAGLVSSVAGAPDSAIQTRVGGGSDYAVFLNFLGVPIVDLRFEGPWRVSLGLRQSRLGIALRGSRFSPARRVDAHLGDTDDASCEHGCAAVRRGPVRESDWRIPRRRPAALDGKVRARHINHPHDRGRGVGAFRSCGRCRRAPYI